MPGKLEFCVNGTPYLTQEPILSAAVPAVGDRIVLDDLEPHLVTHRTFAYHKSGQLVGITYDLIPEHVV